MLDIIHFIVENIQDKHAMYYILFEINNFRHICNVSTVLYKEKASTHLFQARLRHLNITNKIRDEFLVLTTLYNNMKSWDNTPTSKNMVKLNMFSDLSFVIVDMVEPLI